MLVESISTSGMTLQEFDLFFQIISTLMVINENGTLESLLFLVVNLRSMHYSFSFGICQKYF